MILLGALRTLSLPLSGTAADGPREELPAVLPRAGNDSPAEFVIGIWSSGEGLPVNDILDLKETPDGYLWLGTHHGLVRFDGFRFETFFATPTGRRYGARIWPLEVDGRGRLWLAPDEVGLVYLEGGGFSEVLTNGGTLDARVECLCSDGTDSLYWVDEDGGLGRVAVGKPDRAERVAADSAPGARWLRDFEGRLWLAGPRNLRVYEPPEWREVAVPGSAPFVAAPRRDAGLWIAREARLRFVMPDGATRVVADFPWRGQSRVTCMLEDRQQRLWIGTVSQGVFCYAAGQFKQVVPMASSISCLLEDGQDNLWAGTRGGGLVRVRERHFFVHDLRSGLPNEFLRSLPQDRTGRVWILTAEGCLGW